MHRAHGICEVKRQEPGWKSGNVQKMQFQIQDILGDTFQEEDRASEFTSALKAFCRHFSIPTSFSENSKFRKKSDSQTCRSQGNRMNTAFRGTGREGHGHQRRDRSPLEDRVDFRE